MIAIPASTDFTQPVQALDIQGSVIDLTSATNVQCVVYQEPREGAVASLTLTTANSGVVITDAGDGQANFVFEPGDLSVGEYTYVWTATLASGADVLLGRGSLEVF